MLPGFQVYSGFRLKHPLDILLYSLFFILSYYQSVVFTITFLFIRGFNIATFYIEMMPSMPLT